MEVSPNRTHLSTTSDTSHVGDKTTERNVGDDGQSDSTDSNGAIGSPAVGYGVSTAETRAGEIDTAFSWLLLWAYTCVVRTYFER